MREAPSLSLIRGLVREGASVQAYDPEATKEAKALLKDVDGHVTYLPQEL